LFTTDDPACFSAVEDLRRIEFNKELLRFYVTQRTLRAINERRSDRQPKQEIAELKGTIKILPDSIVVP
jgi:tRNA U54 and U55 pseudouridine synthase Pus10